MFLIMKWIKGRQGGEYSKLKLLQYKFMDCWLLRYEPYYVMPEHNDPVKNKRHYRMNIELWGKGNFTCEKTIINILNKFIVFRPDLYKHKMNNGKSRRYVLSIGWVMNK